MKRFTGKDAIQELINVFKQEILDISNSFSGLLNNHKLDKNNPHMVSIGQIGAAPAGLVEGIIITGTHVRTLNELVETIIVGYDSPFSHLRSRSGSIHIGENIIPPP